MNDEDGQSSRILNVIHTHVSSDLDLYAMCETKEDFLMVKFPLDMFED